MMRLRTFLYQGTHLLLICLILFLSGCDALTPEIIEKTGIKLPFAIPEAAQKQADKPKELTVYTVLSVDQVAAYLPLFEQEHPDIKVEIVRLSTWDMVKKTLAEKNQPSADIMWGLAATAMLQLQAEGMLQAYEAKGKAADQLKKVSARMRDRADPPQWLGMDVWVGAVCVNTNRMEELGLPIPQSWEDLTDPIYKGQIVMANPNSSGTSFMTLTAWIQIFGEEQAWTYMDALNQNVVMYTSSGRKPCQLASQGKVPLGISFSSAINDERKVGAPLDALFPSEGSGWEIETVGLIKKEVIKPEAIAFMDWAISDSAMRAYAKFYPQTAIKTDYILPEGSIQDPPDSLIPNRFIWSSANYDRITSQWLQRYESKAENGSFDVPDSFK